MSHLTSLLAEGGIPTNILQIPWGDIMESVGLPQDKFLLELITIPIFSAIAGLLTNWTGVLMLFAPARFTGFYTPGVKTLFNFLPRKVQVLPIFAPGGILGFQGFIPARAEKMAAIVVDKAVYKIATINDIFQEMDPDAIAEHVAEFAKKDIRGMTAQIMERDHAELWASLTPQVREVVFQRVEAELPGIVKTAFKKVGDNVDQLVDIKLLAVGYLRANPDVLKDLIYGVARPELKFMVKIGLLGFPFGAVLAVWLHFYHHIPLIGAIPGWLMVLTGAALIGIVVNIFAIRIVFTPGEPQPRYKYLWKQALLAKRQPSAAADLGHAFAYQVLTLPLIANEILNGPRGDKTRGLLDNIVSTEVDRILGPLKQVVRVAVGGGEFDAIRMDTAGAALEFAPQFLEDEEFAKVQAAKIDKFATEKLRALPPGEFMEMIYSAIEQDAWLLYLHGGLLGIVVGAVHILIFGA